MANCSDLLLKEFISVLVERGLRGPAAEVERAPHARMPRFDDGMPDDAVR